ncbi:MAG: hypothetical protein ABIK09_04490 [Pseudomonadota bacterium]
MGCDDGNPCTDDACVDGVCVLTPNAAGCDDGNPCTDGDHCTGGACKATGPVPCDDDSVCTTDYCDPTSGCVFVLNDAPCDDGEPCTVGDHCAAGECVPTGVVDCWDDNDCTTDACAPQTGQCVYTPDDGATCDDVNACTNNVCQGGLCIILEVEDCQDGDLCTDDWCDPVTGCKHALNTVPCNDGDLCTTADACAAGVCVGGATLPCADGNPCTDDGCDPQAGCTFTPNTATCDDGNACTEDDACASGACAPGDAADCDDGELCTTDSCVTALGCQNVPNTAPCDDDDACTNGDTCSSGSCQPGAAVTCTDGDPCTTDSCDPASGCVYTPITPCCGNDVVEAGEECDDGNQTPGDGCDGSCQDEVVALTYLGYATWTQDVSSQTDAQQDALMNSACAAAFGNARAATHDELVTGQILGKPGSNNSGYWCMFKCPYCAGTGGCRKCVNPNTAWPTSHGSGWHDYCCNNTRSTICVPN